MASELERLRDVVRKMTPGPWELQHPGHVRAAVSRSGRYKGMQVAACRGASATGEFLGGEQDANAVGIAVTRNVIEALVDALSAADDLCDEVAERNYNRLNYESLRETVNAEIDAALTDD